MHRFEVYLFANLAVMRLLASMNSRVNGQGGALDECLSTIRMITPVRLVTTVYSFYKLSQRVIVLSTFFCSP